MGGTKALRPNLTPPEAPTVSEMENTDLKAGEEPRLALGRPWVSAALPRAGGGLQANRLATLPASCHCQVVRSKQTMRLKR